MTTKSEFIAQIRADHPDWDSQQIIEYANTPYLHANPIAQPTVPKPLSIGAIADSIPPVDRSIIQNELSGTYQSLLANINKGQVQDVGRDVANLIASGKLSSTAVTALQAAIADVVAGQPDPNWQPEIYTTRCQDLGLPLLLLSDLEP